MQLAMHLQVQLEAAVFSETFVAQLAVEAFLSSVNRHVSLESLRKREAFIACYADVRFLIRMKLCMSFEHGAGLEALSTQGADKVPEAQVNPADVLLHDASLVKAPAAEFTRERALASVDSDVVCEVTTLAETFAAEIASIPLFVSVT